MTQMAMADVYIWLDDVQFSKGSFTNRVQVKMQSGRKWMTVPLQGTGSHQLITEISAKDNDWAASHREMLKQSFRGYRSADVSLALFDKVISSPLPLCSMLIASAEEQANAIGCLPPRILRSSSMSVNGSSSSRVLSLVKAAGGTHYLTGHGAAAYLDHHLLNDEGITVSYMDYTVEPWPQSFGSFNPYVTALDLLAATGTSAAKHLRPASVDWRVFCSVSDHSVGQSPKS